MRIAAVITLHAIIIYVLFLKPPAIASRQSKLIQHVLIASVHEIRNNRTEVAIWLKRKRKVRIQQARAFIHLSNYGGTVTLHQFSKACHLKTKHTEQNTHSRKKWGKKLDFFLWFVVVVVAFFPNQFTNSGGKYNRERAYGHRTIHHANSISFSRLPKNQKQLRDDLFFLVPLFFMLVCNFI